MARVQARVEPQLIAGGKIKRTSRAGANASPSSAKSAERVLGAAPAGRGIDIESLANPPAGWPLRPTMPPGVQRVGPLSEIPGLLTELGARPADVLRRAGLGADALADLDARIGFIEAGRLLEASVEATARADFPLLLAARWRLAHIGVVGELIRSCATVAQALETFASFQWLNASGGAVFLRRDGVLTTIGYAVYEPNMTHGMHHVYDLVMGIGAQLMRELTGMPHLAPERVRLPRPRPADVAPYRRFFRAPVQFDAEAGLLQYAARVDAMPLKSRDEARRRQLAAQVAGRHEEIVPKVHRMARVALLFGLSAENLSRAMFMSHRTMNRRLSDSGVNFREILASVRHEAARQLLRDTELSVAEIASALGYAESSPFVRAFRRWSGTTPLTWRAREGRRQGTDEVRE